jgi:dihydrolipoamide dehydrogenase
MYNRFMTNHTGILIIGGGPAGLHAALAAAGQGKRVTLVSEMPPGGRAAWQTLLPSKMWLQAGWKRAPATLEEMRARYETVAGTWQRQMVLELERAGVELVLGTAVFTGPHEVEVRPPEGGYGEPLTADTIIIAVGAVPFVPPGMQPDGERVLSPHLIWKLRELPRSMVVIGAGGPATEYVDAFSRLGVQITWVTGPTSVLSAFPMDAGRFISEVMQRRGVKVVPGILAREIERVDVGGKPCVRVQAVSGAVFEADMAFVATGLRPDLGRLNLPAAGLKVGSSGGMATDPFYRSAHPHIYLVGDAASPLSANISIAQGRVAGWHAAGLAVEPVRTDLAVMAIYTEPQIAMVGQMSDRSGGLQKVRVPFNSCLRAHLLEAPDHGIPGILDGCFVEIAYDTERRVMGALGVCPEAAEILTPLAVAIRAGLTLDVLASVYAAHPTFSELAILAARMAR